MAGFHSCSDPLQMNLSHYAAGKDSGLFIKGWKPPGDDAPDASEIQSKRVVHPSCCACFIIIIGLSVLLILVVGSAYCTFFVSNLPEAKLHGFDVTSLNLTYSSNKMAFLTSDFTFHINLMHEDGNLGIGYSAMTASISSTGIEFPDVHLDSVRRNGRGDMELKVRSWVDRMVVDEVAGRELEKSARAHMMKIRLMIDGRVDFYYRGMWMYGFPFEIDCHYIDQMHIENGLAPPCNIYISHVSHLHMTRFSSANI